MKMYLTKYAIRNGIEEVESDDDHTGSDYIRLNGYSTYFKVGCDVHLTREDAIRQAEKMRTARINSLTKQIDKLTKMSF